MKFFRRKFFAYRLGRLGPRTDLDGPDGPHPEMNTTGRFIKDVPTMCCGDSHCSRGARAMHNFVVNRILQRSTDSARGDGDFKIDIGTAEINGST